MTQDNKQEMVSVHKIEGDRVEVGLSEFIEMCNQVRAYKEVEKTNLLLQKMYKKLSDELEYVRQASQQTKNHSAPIIVYRRATDGTMHVQYIEGLQQGQDGTIYITIGEPS